MNTGNIQQISGGVNLSGLLPENEGIPGRKWRTLHTFAVIYVTDGGGTYIDSKSGRHRVSSPCLITIPPGLPHVYFATPAKSWCEYFIQFSGDLFTAWLEAGLMNSLLPLIHLEPVNYWISRLREVPGPSNPSATEQFEESQKLQKLVFDLVHYNEGVETGIPSRWNLLASEAIQKNLLSENPIQAAADSIGESYESFRKKFRMTTGESPGRWHSKRLMDEARRRIEQTDLSIKEISAGLGFADAFHFSKRFRQINGQSPSQYRQQHRRNLRLQ